MKRLLVLAVGLFGLVAYMRRRRTDALPAVEPADELRARLAQSKLTQSGMVAEPEPEPVSVQQDEAPPDGVGERRQDVHERARAALDELG